MTFPCRPITTVAAGEPVTPEIHGVGLDVCIVVGPGQAGAAGCQVAGWALPIVGP